MALCEKWLGAFVIEAKVPSQKRISLYFALLLSIYFFTVHYMVHLAILHAVRKYLWKTVVK